MKKNLLLNTKTMITIVITLFSILMVSCEKDNDDPIIEPPAPPIVEGINFISATGSTPKVVLSDLGFTRTDDIVAKFTIKAGKVTRDTTANRTLVSSYTALANEDVIIVKEGSIIAMPIAKLVSNTDAKEGDKVTTTKTYEYEFASGGKMKSVSITDSSSVTAYGKTVGILFNNETVPASLTYDESQNQILEGSINVEGIDYTRVKVLVKETVKSGTEEKVIVRPQIFGFKGVYDPIVGEPKVVASNLVRTNDQSWASSVTVEVKYKSGRVENITKESNIEAWAKQADDDFIFRKSKTVSYKKVTETPVEVAGTDGEFKVNKKTLTFGFDFGDFVSDIKTYVEIKTFEVEGITFTLPHPDWKATFVNAEVAAEISPEHSNAYYDVYLAEISFSVVGTENYTQPITNNVYLKLDHGAMIDNPYNINIAKTKEIGGVTWGWKGDEKVVAVVVVYGVPEYDIYTTGLQSWINEQKVRSTTWDDLEDSYGNKLSVAYSDRSNRWTECFYKYDNTRGWRWTSIDAYNPKWILKMDVFEDPKIPSEFIENADGSLTIKYVIDGVEKSITAKNFK